MTKADGMGLEQTPVAADAVCRDLRTLIDPSGRDAFEARLRRHFNEIEHTLRALYGGEPDFADELTRILETAARGWADRSLELRAHDLEREADPAWFLDHHHMGAVCYVDRFAGDLQGLRSRLDYFAELGITYLHLMPLFRTPDGDNDGGYAVSDYRSVAPEIGTMAELADLAAEFRRRGISLVLDFILNHTADNHAWAQRAKAGDPAFQAYYFMYDDREEPERFLPMLREIFPDRGGDSFIWRGDVAGPHCGKWVWSTFYPFQWDLNYRNPAVFRAILGEMLFLANQGVEILRLDAVPFLWKAPGTTCENLPEAHLIVQALNALSDIAAPSLVFKSEAIVHPDEVARYIDPGQCHLSYNPLFMVLMWEALATRDTRHIHYCLETRFRTAEGTAWVNYIRSHDDIGWGFADQDAHHLGIDPYGHRRFLNDFYSGEFTGSFANGLRFQENPRTGDCRIVGTLASLAGLERAIEHGDDREISYSIRRILLMHGLIMTLGGVPLIYLGDEIAQLNDDGFRDDPGHSRDRRWVHRPLFDERRLDHARNVPESPEGQVFAGLKRLIAIRKQQEALSGNDMAPFRLDERYLIAYHRTSGRGRMTIIGNLSEHQIDVAYDALQPHSADGKVRDMVSEMELDLRSGLAIEPYQLLLIKAGD